MVLPDKQYYSDVDSPNAGSPDYFHDQTQWVRDNREALEKLAPEIESELLALDEGEISRPVRSPLGPSKNKTDRPK